MKPNIDQCIKCSICNAYCPVFKATGLFPGPKLSGPDAGRFRQKGKFLPADWLELCDYCKICEMVCPHNVPIPNLHIHARKALGKPHLPSLRDWLLGHSYLLGRLGNWASPLSNCFMRSTIFRWFLERGLNIDRRAKIPSYPKYTFAKWFHARKPSTGNPLAYFHGCYTNYIEPELGQAVVGVLERNGFQVIVPDQECCGLPLIGNGFFDLAAKLGQKNLKSLRKVVEKRIDIIFSSTSCGMTLKHEYESILELPGASVLTDHLFEISQFLVRLHEEGRLDLNFKPLQETYYYHAPCHLRALQIGLPALELLSLIPGIKLVELPDGCCGLAGTYGFKKEKCDIAMEVGEDIFQAIREQRVRKVISDCEACRMQIGQQTGVETFHPVQILMQAYGV
jgi:glycerol-3-phosphate dehydrogenase subunit C